MKLAARLLLPAARPNPISSSLYLPKPGNIENACFQQLYFYPARPSVFLIMSLIAFLISFNRNLTVYYPSVFPILAFSRIPFPTAISGFRMRYLPIAISAFSLNIGNACSFPSFIMHTKFGTF